MTFEKGIQDAIWNLSRLSVDDLFLALRSMSKKLITHGKIRPAKSDPYHEPSHKRLIDIRLGKKGPLSRTCLARDCPGWPLVSTRGPSFMLPLHEPCNSAGPSFLERLPSYSLSVPWLSRYHVSVVLQPCMLMDHRTPIWHSLIPMSILIRNRFPPSGG